MDALVLLANEEDMLNIMNDYGIQNLFEIINLQKYATGEVILKKDATYQSFMGDTKIDEKVPVILNQIVAVLREQPKTLEVEEDAKEETPEENKE